MAEALSRGRSVLHARCPRCRSGAMFEHFFVHGGRIRWPYMYPYCPVCGLKYEREEGYFLGAMYISYGLALGLIAAFTAIVFATTRLGFYGSVLAGLIIFVPLVPLIAIASRVLWIHMDRAIDPD
jgi:uncharacterized protein (DUF983 family)